MSDGRMDEHRHWLLIGAVVFSFAVYLMYCASYFRIGFPLDDAWIHQTYARNLIESGRWIYTENTGSGGSTAPLWTLMLSVGYLLNLPPKLWTYILGGAALIFTAAAGIRWYEKSSDSPLLSGSLLGLLIVFEWHLIWAALSGMETIISGFLAVTLFLVLLDADKRFIYAGVLIAIGVWIRPDSILLLLPALWVLVFSKGSGRKTTDWLRGGLNLSLSFTILFIPYLLFNYFSAGSIWPRTFFAKQAEYAVLLQKPLLERIIPMLQAPLAGVGILLLPAVIYYAFAETRSRRYDRLAPIIWIICYFGVYALRLPVTYQHGRYLIPVLPVGIVLGYMGLEKLLGISAQRKLPSIVQKTWSFAIPAVLAVFWVAGTRAYAQDVAIIESEMVETAQWIREKTPSGAIIAAHDIGAFGYFADRDLLDLAGLVSPDVIPIIRDEEALEQLMNRENVDYLMTFPGWYPHLTAVGEKIFQTKATFSPQQGGENMAVYRWP
jgi:arabinofuranosyltransferase